MTLKTVLIITYYWPPSGGSGVQRWLKFTQYLESFGWHTIVVTPENPQFHSKDLSLEEEIHKETEVLKIPIWEPYHLVEKLKGSHPLQQGSTSQGTAGWMKTLRGNAMIPDPRIFWKRPVLKFLSEFLRNRNVDAIVTTGPPHSMHLIGRSLHRKSRIPWLADFRDPWSTWDMLDEFNLSGPVRNLHRKLEAAVVKEADAVVTVSQTWAREFSAIHNTSVDVITNGFDPKDFKGKARPESFRLAHFGLINEFRHAPMFWEALADALEETPAIKDKLCIDLFGVMDDQIQDYFLHHCPVREFITLHAPISHTAVVEEYYRSAVLLLFMNKTLNADGHIPGKLFEYLAVGRPILGLGNPQGDTAKIINRCGAGKIVDWDDKRAMTAEIIRMFNAYLEGQFTIPSNENTHDYERSGLTKKLVTILNRISG